MHRQLKTGMSYDSVDMLMESVRMLRCADLHWTLSDEAHKH